MSSRRIDIARNGRYSRRVEAAINKISVRTGIWWSDLNTHKTWNGWRPYITIHQRSTRTTSTYAGFVSASSRRSSGLGKTCLRWKFTAKVRAPTGNWWCNLNIHETCNGWRLDITAHQWSGRIPSTYTACVFVSSRLTAGH